MSNLNDRIGMNTQVFINIQGTVGGRKITVNEVVTVGELGVNVAAGAAPEYPAMEFMAINMDPTLTPSERQVKTTRLMKDFEKAQQEYARGGGQSILNKIASAVCTFGKNRTGATFSPQGLTVTPQLSNGAVIVIVQGAPVWG